MESDTSSTFLESAAAILPHALKKEAAKGREKEPGPLHLWNHVYGRCLLIYLNSFVQPKAIL